MDSIISSIINIYKKKNNLAKNFVTQLELVGTSIEIVLFQIPSFPSIELFTLKKKNQLEIVNVYININEIIKSKFIYFKMNV